MQEFRLPDPGEGLTEAEIVTWRVRPGDTVHVNDVLLEVETAKSLVELPSPFEGTVEALLAEEGQTVEVGTPIIRVSGGDADAVETTIATQQTVDRDEDGGAVLVGYGVRGGAETRRRKPHTVRDVPAPASARPAPLASVPAASAAPVIAKPPIRKLAKDLGVDLTTLTGTGPQGSITRDDVQRALEASAAPAPAAGEREERVPVKGVRKLTAENMVASAFTAPHVTEFLTVDVTRSVRALERLRKQPGWRDVRISPLLLVARAVLAAIGRHPMVNSTWQGDEILVKRYVNLGIAAATERGLIVPNVKDADRLSLRDLADALNDLVAVAKEGRTPPTAMTGGTFTITNVGVFGVDTGTPILPPGEAAILAFGVIRETPWVHKGKIKIRHVTTLGMSFDHRIIDGELGSRFLRDVGAFLTDPETALLAWS
jgi:2-oxoisovalerate dehydrogenase E2 component (dihydrolipoyl transacylase)